MEKSEQKTSCCAAAKIIEILLISRWTFYQLSYLRRRRKKEISRTRRYFNYHNSLFSLVSRKRIIRLGEGRNIEISENGSRWPSSRCHSFRKIQQKNAIRNLECKRNAREETIRARNAREKKEGKKKKKRKKKYSRCNNTATRTPYETPPLSKVSLLIFYVCLRVRACVCVFSMRVRENRVSSLFRHAHGNYRLLRTRWSVLSLIIIT